MTQAAGEKLGTNYACRAGKCNLISEPQCKQLAKPQEKYRSRQSAPQTSGRVKRSALEKKWIKIKAEVKAVNFTLTDEGFQARAS